MHSRLPHVCALRDPHGLPQAQRWISRSASLRCHVCQGTSSSSTLTTCCKVPSFLAMNSTPSQRQG